MADKQESWFQAFALNVLLVASICTVGVAGYTIYNLNGTLSGVNKTVSSAQAAVDKANGTLSGISETVSSAQVAVDEVNSLLDQANAVAFDKDLLDGLSSSIVAYEDDSSGGEVTARVLAIRQFVANNFSPRISSKVQTSLREFVDGRQPSDYHDLNELLKAVSKSLENCTKGSTAGLVFEIRKLLCSADGLMPDAEQLLKNFNSLTLVARDVLQEMHQNGVIHKIGNVVDGVNIAVSVLNDDLVEFDIDCFNEFFGGISATVEKLEKYAVGHSENITQEDRDLLKNMGTVYSSDVKECLAPSPGVTKGQYIKRWGLSGKDFKALRVLADFDDEDIENSEKYGELMQVLREYPKGLSSCIICFYENFWFNLSDMVKRVNQEGALSALLGGSGAGSDSDSDSGCGLGYGLGVVLSAILMIFNLLRA